MKLTSRVHLKIFKGQPSELYIFDIWNDNLQSFNRGKNEASVPVFYADWTSVSVPRTSSSRGLDVGFIPLLPKELPYMANNDEYLCRDFFVGFNQVSIFGRGYHSRYQNFEFTGPTLTNYYVIFATVLWSSISSRQCLIWINYDNVNACCPYIWVLLSRYSSYIKTLADPNQNYRKLFSA